MFNRYIIFLLISISITACNEVSSNQNTTVKIPHDTSKMDRVKTEDWTWDVEYKIVKENKNINIDFWSGTPNKVKHFQHFIDVDNSPNTGFSGSDGWIVSGADYLIEDNQLYKCLSNKEWKWKYIGEFKNLKFTQDKESNSKKLILSDSSFDFNNIFSSDNFNIFMEAYDTNWDSTYPTIGVMSVDTKTENKTPLQQLQSKIVSSFCSQNILNQIPTAKEKFKTFKTTKYKDNQLKFSEDLYSINSIILPLTCDKIVKNSKSSEAVDLISYWVEHYQLNQEKREKFYIKDDYSKIVVNNSTYDYGSKNIRKATSIILKDIIDTNKKNKIKKYLENDLTYNLFNKDNFDKNDFIFNTDYLYNSAEGLLGYIAFNDDRELIKFKKYIEKFIEPIDGWKDGIKPDGLGFHHGIHYNAYMYAYNSIIDLLYYLDKSPYQIGKEKYNFFTNSIYSISLMNKNRDELPSLGGRHPFYISFPISKTKIKSLLTIGGHIFGDEIDTKMASMYYRLWEDKEYKKYYNSDYATGFWQFNYGALGIYRKDNWLIGMHGFNYSFKGGEISPTSSGKNMYGRYQAYGTVEIMYDGGKKNSGFPTTLPLKNQQADMTMGDRDGFGWDWNRWPGTTSIVLPWEKLLPTISSSNELNEKKFAGALRFQDKKSGIFAMDFQQYNWNRPNHNSSFTFKKSIFAYDDIVVSLGSNINNNDTQNQTITTLFQNATDKLHRKIYIDGIGELENDGVYELNSNDNKWIIDAYGTGYFLKFKDTKFTLSISNQTSPNRIDTKANMENSTTGHYATAWIEHGKAPKDQYYFYIIVPNATEEKMQTLAYETISIPHLNNHNHMIYIPKRKLMGYILFKAQDNIDTGILKSTNKAILAMYKLDKNNNLSLTVVNPDLGYKYYLKDTTNIKNQNIEIVLKGRWKLKKSSKKVTISNSIENQTKLQFFTKNGLPVDINLTKEQ